MSVEKRIKEIIVENLGVSEDEIKTESHFIDDLNADSLDTVELMLALENEFDLDDIPDEDAEKLITVGAAVSYVEEKLKGK